MIEDIAKVYIAEDVLPHGRKLTGRTIEECQSELNADENLYIAYLDNYTSAHKVTVIRNELAFTHAKAKLDNRFNRNSLTTWEGFYAVHQSILDGLVCEEMKQVYVTVRFAYLPIRY